jgi:hypothetical protein
VPHENGSKARKVGRPTGGDQGDDGQNPWTVDDEAEAQRRVGEPLDHPCVCIAGFDRRPPSLLGVVAPDLTTTFQEPCRRLLCNLEEDRSGIGDAWRQSRSVVSSRLGPSPGRRGYVHLVGAAADRELPRRKGRQMTSLDLTHCPQSEVRSLSHLAGDRAPCPVCRQPVRIRRDGRWPRHVGPILRRLPTSEVELCVSALRDATEDLQHAISWGAVTADWLADIEAAHEAFVRTLSAGQH